jgi:hypothetical protein
MCTYVRFKVVTAVKIHIWFLSYKTIQSGKWVSMFWGTFYVHLQVRSPCPDPEDHNIKMCAI